MTNQQQYQLIDLLDRTLTEQEMREVELLIQTDNEARQQWQYLQMAVQAVEYAALYEQVAAVKEEFRSVTPMYTAPATKGRVRTMATVFRVAATFVILFTAIAVYKYISTSSSDVYKQGYLSYDLNTSRSGGALNELEQAYRNKNWQSVLYSYNSLAQKDNKARFLAGMAHMELKEFPAAVQEFKQVLAQNAQTGDDYFHDEAEYYLAMSYLAQNKAKDALPIIEKIRADKGHLFHEQANRITTMDLKIISIKSGK